MKIRDANHDDAEAIKRVHRSAFPAEESEPIAALASGLLEEASTPATVNLVAEEQGEVVGHVAFSPVFDAEDQACLGYILAPLAVRADCQKKGVGSALVKHGIDQLNQAGTGVVLVYGDPAYYGRFGFDAEHGQCYVPPYPLAYPFGWQALTPAPTGQPLHFSVVEPLQREALW